MIQALNDFILLCVFIIQMKLVNCILNLSDIFMNSQCIY